MGCRVRVTRLLISNLAMVSVTISCGTRFNDLAFSWWAIVGRVNGRSCRDFSGPRVCECCEWMTSCGNRRWFEWSDWREFAILSSSLCDSSINLSAMIEFLLSKLTGISRFFVLRNFWIGNFFRIRSNFISRNFILEIIIIGFSFLRNFCNWILD